MIATASITNCTPAGGDVNVFISAMSFLLRVFSALTAVSKAGRASFRSLSAASVIYLAKFEQAVTRSTP